MSTRVWDGTSGYYEDAANWVGGVAPVIGDTLVVAAGTLTLRGAFEPQPGSYDGLTIALGSGSAGAPAALVLDDATLGHFVTLASTSAGAYATLTSTGTSGFEGKLTASAAGGTFTIQAATPDGANPADFVLLHGGSITVSGGDTLQQIGRLDDHGTITVTSAGTLVLNGTLNTAAGSVDVQSASTIEGSGTVAIGMFSSLYLEAGSGAANIAVEFTDVGGRLRLGTPSNFTGQVSNFLVGDIIDLTNSTADYAYAAAGTLTVRNGGATGAIVATLNVAGAGANGVMSVTSDGASGVYIAAADALTRTKYTVTAADKALKSDVVRATMKTAGGATIDGTGVRIGIISDSFDHAPGVGAADPANADAIAGYLPLAKDGVTCAVTVLQDSTYTGNEDEGRAMAELIHQIAPGAQLYFYDSSNFAAGVTALAGAGCNIIVDDISFFTEPYFQVAGPIDSAIESAVASGVNYFTSAGNYADASFEANFAASYASTTLSDGSTVNAYIFGNGTPYQTITTAANGTFIASIYLQWDAPYPTSARSVSPVELMVKVFDTNGTLVATSTRSTLSSGGTTLTIPGENVSLPGTSPTTYRIAIYNPSGAPVPGTFDYILRGSGNGTGPGGVIDDPLAQQAGGTVSGHHLLPDVNSVGATDFPNAAAYDNPATSVDYFSSTGTGTFLFDASGNRLATPVSAGKPNFVAPDGAGTAVSGFASFYGTSAAAPDAAAVAALMLQANPNLGTAKVTALLEQSAADLGLSAAVQGAGLIQADVAVALAEAACFVAGTRIRTPRGLCPIERLAIGDTVLTATGRTAPVRWIGHRSVDVARHPRPETVTPLCIRAGAFAPGQPERDLLLSPDHAVFADGELIPVRYLANGATIAPQPRRHVAYYHVELDRHDVLLADDLACESYLDTGNRGAFDNAPPGTPVHLSADFALGVWAAQSVAPLCVGGAVLAAVRSVLLLRAEELGWHTTREADLHLLVDGARIDPAWSGATACFVLPAGAGRVVLASRSSVPAELLADGDDHRRLGVAVRALALDHAAIALNDARLAGGWHAAEAAWRWTAGAAGLDCGEACLLEVTVAGLLPYRLPRAA